MRASAHRAALVAVAQVLAASVPAAGQQVDHTDHVMPADSAVVEPHDMAAHGAGGAHDMWSIALPGGWSATGMAQAFPILTAGFPSDEGSPLRETAMYLTQPAAMGWIRSPGSRVALRLTLNFEALTQEGGEINFGGWGEGFIDKRHPHSLIHEATVSVNLPSDAGGGISITAGRGFAPYGTDDPMGRPGLKYPTNHHLSQVLERWTVNGLYLRGPWSLEAGLFAGGEPEDPYDLSNVEGFGESWSVRLIRRWGVSGGAGTSGETPVPPSGAGATWEASASWASVREEHEGEIERSGLANAAVRYEGARTVGDVYALAEVSLGGPTHASPYHSALIEVGLGRGRHAPYARVEYATRPEFPRSDPSGGEGLFRYARDAEAGAASRWLILNLGYGFAATSGAVSVRPFVDLQAHGVALDRGPAAAMPDPLRSAGTLWTLSVGARVLLGGGPMRMGSYGWLDPMGVAPAGTP